MCLNVAIFVFVYTGYEAVDDESVGLLKEIIEPRKKIPTLLKRLTERKPERLDYIGTSYGLTIDLLKFWKSQDFVPVYLRYVDNWRQSAIEIH